MSFLVPFLPALIGAGGAIGATALANRGSGDVREATADAASAEAQGIQDRQRRMNELEALIKGAAGGAAPPTVRFGLRSSDQRVPDQLEGKLRPMADINLLMQLAGMGQGSGALNAASYADTARRSQTANLASSLGGSLSQLLQDALNPQQSEQVIQAPPATDLTHIFGSG